MKACKVLEKLNVTRKTLNSYVKSGKVRVKELGNRFYDYDEVDVNRLAKDVSYRNKAVVYIGKDFHEFGCITNLTACEVLGLDARYSRCDIAFALCTISDDNHFVERLEVFLKCQLATFGFL